MSAPDEAVYQYSKAPGRTGYETPRKSLAVNAIMWLSRAVLGGGLQTPHMSKGRAAAREKVLFEYEGAPGFVARLKEFFDFGQTLSNKSVLDVGCGWGGKTVYYAEKFGPSLIHGFDLPGEWQEPAESFAREKGVADRCTFSQAWAEDVPLGDNLFDVLVCEDVLEHVSDPTRVIAECKRVLKPGGLLIAKFPSFRSLTAHHLDRATRLPGLHFILPMRTLAGGLNWLRERSPAKYGYEPFRKVVRTPYADVTSDLNGMDFRGFSEVVRQSGLIPEQLKLVPAKNFGGSRALRLLLAPIYRTLWSVRQLSEHLSSFILLVARKP